MISQQALFAQMELKLQQAKNAGSEAQMREALSALQVLCNVVLDSDVDVMQQHTIVVAPQTPILQPKVQQTTTKFDDANGDSLFDF